MADENVKLQQDDPDYDAKSVMLGLDILSDPPGDTAEPDESSQTPPLDQQKPDETSAKAGHEDSAPSEKAEPAKKPEADKPGDREFLDNLRNIMHRANPQRPTEEKPKKEEDLPTYQTSVPTELVRALRSEDDAEFAQGLQGLVAGVGRMVHTQVRAEFAKKLNDQQQQIAEQMTRTVSEREAAQQVATDFYGAYPELNHPMIRPMVVEAAKSISARNPNAQWSQQVRDEIAQAVKAAIEPLMPKQETPQPAPAPKPQANFNGNRGPTSPQSRPRDEVRDTLLN